MKAMIFAAGLGTRLQHLTNNKPKALVNLNGVPLLQHVIFKLKKAGINEMIINIHHFGNQIIQFLQDNNNFGCKISISDERNTLLETGGGLKKAANLLAGHEPILIYNADIISDIDINALANSHIENDAIATLAMSTRPGSRKLVFDSKNFLCCWENTQTNEIKPARTPVGTTESLSFSGIHIISPKLLQLITEKGKFSIIEVYLRLAKDYKISSTIPNCNYWFDAGKIETLKEAEKFLNALE